MLTRSKSDNVIWPFPGNDVFAISKKRRPQSSSMKIDMYHPPGESCLAEFSINVKTSTTYNSKFMAINNVVGIHFRIGIRRTSIHRIFT